MNTRRILGATTLAMVCCGAFSLARADVPAKVELSNGTVVECRLRWMPASKKYVIIRPAAGGQAMEQQVSPSEIIRKQVAPPAGWRELLQLAAKSPDAALPKLQQIVDEYKMLEYDEQAAYVAGTIYMRKGKPEDAIKICEKVAQDNPAAASISQMAPVYWAALLETGKTGSRLDKMIAEAITSAPSPIAAQALVARGDSLKKAGRTRDALKDGYLRCALLFTKEADANAEALYKASLAFDELRQATYAERMRQTLLSRHRNSEFARKLRGN